MAINFLNNPKVGDNVKIEVGDSSDLTIFHDGNSIIRNTVGDLYIDNYADDKDIIFRSDDGSGSQTAYITIDGSDVLTKMHKSVRHLDGVKALFGASDDLQIYHDGSNSYISDVGTGELLIRSNLVAIQNAAGTENMAKFDDDAGVKLFYDDSQKFETTSSGVKVTSEGYQINIEDSSSGNISEILTSNNAMGFFADRANSVASTSMIFSVDNTTALTIDDSQNATFSGAVTIDSSTATLNIKGSDTGASLINFADASDGNVGRIYYDHTSNFMQFKVNDTEKMRITSAGNVGIGEASVDARLHITTATAGLVNQKFESAGSAAWRLGIPASQTYFAFDNANDNLSSPKLIISSSGNLGIGTTSATNKLTISDNSAQILLIDTSTSNKGEIEIGDADFTFNLDRDGGISSGKFAWRIDDITRMELGLDSGDLGQLRLNEYGSGNITGTATKLLGVDENGYIIEESTSGGGTVTGTGAATRVAFWSGTSALSSDANLYWDNTNDRLGIGTTSPDTLLELKGTNPILTVRDNTTALSDANATLRLAESGANDTLGNYWDLKMAPEAVGGSTNFAITNSTIGNAFYINYEGNVGIGTTSPTVKLAVEQNVNSSASILVSNPNTGTGARSNLILTSDAARIDMYATSSTYNGVSSWTDAGVITTSSATSGGLILNAQSGDIKFQQGTSEKMRINSSGNVGIGTTSPSYRLTVNDSTANGRGIQVVQSATSGTNYGIQGGAYGSGATKNIGLSITAEGATTNDAAHFLGGNVGIGTTSPDAKLDIQGDGADFFLQSADHKIARIQPRGTGVNLDKGLFSLFNGSTESVRIDTDGNSWLNGGNVGIGLTSPSHKIDVSDSSTTWAGKILNTNLRGYGLLVRSDSTTASDLIFGAYGNGGAGAGYKMAIQADGNVGIGTISPTRQLQINNSAAAATSLRLTNGAASISTGGDFGLSSGGDLAVWHNDSLGIVFGTNNTERMRITTGGNLQVKSSSVPTILLYNTDTSLGTDQTLGDLDWYQSDPSGDGVGVVAKIRGVNSGSSFKGQAGLAFYTGTPISLAERMCIDSTGKVGIGVSNPTEKFEVDGAILWSGALGASQTSAGVLDRSGDNLRIRAYGATAGSGALQFRTGGGADAGDSLALTIDSSQNSTFAGEVQVRKTRSNTAGVVGLSIQPSDTTAEYGWRIDQTSNNLNLDYVNTPLNLVSYSTTGNATFAGNVTANGNYSAGQSAIIYKAQRSGGAVASDWSYDDATTDMSLGTSTSHSFSLKTGNTRALTIDTSQNATFAGDITVSNSSPQITLLDTTNNTDALIYSDDAGSINISADENNEQASSAIKLYVDGGEKMRIDSSGQVGIGTTSPGTKLHVSASGTTQSAVSIGQTGTSTARLYMDASNGDFSGSDYMWIGQNNDLSGEIVMTQNSGAFHIKTQPSGTITSQLTVLQDGKVGISTTSPAEKLTVSGNANITGKFAVGIANAHPSLDFYNQGTAYFNGSTTVDDNLIVTNGRLGLGTAAPSSLLHLSDASSPTIRIVDTTNSVTLLAYAQDSNAHVGTFSNHDLIFDSNSTERMRIAAGGNVGIGTTSPSEALDVNGTIKGTKLGMDQSGSSTSDLSSPDGFIDVVVGGTAYIIPYYTPE